MAIVELMGNNRDSKLQQAEHAVDDVRLDRVALCDEDRVPHGQGAELAEQTLLPGATDQCCW